MHTSALGHGLAIGEIPEEVVLPDSMTAAVIDAPGDACALHLATVATPSAINAEFTVKVVAAGVNRLDATTRAGQGVAAQITSYPAVLGHDFSGVVVASPYPAHSLRQGDEVYGFVMVPRYSGSYAEYVSVPCVSIARKPSTLSHVEAAGVPLAALTAWGMVVELAKAHEGQRILIHAGSGGVGHFAVQFAAYLGASVIATGSTRNMQWLSELGAAQVIDHTTERFDELLSGVDVVIDLIGNVHENTGSRSLTVLRPGGLIVNAPTGSWPGFFEEAAEAGVRASTYRVAPDGATLGVVSRLLESGDVRVFIDRILPLAHACEAHELIETGHTRGKIVLTVSEG
ncbi:NADP-dependent oxidoreductase [Rathayibacter rathayi]|uniref:NADP-dependent oxidoreductase n=1 Tax=Rathayibacter rathayi TaxID=33887 RepID=UPI003B98286B